jgi:hypothetical protein
MSRVSGFRPAAATVLLLLVGFLLITSAPWTPVSVAEKAPTQAGPPPAEPASFAAPAAPAPPPGSVLHIVQRGESVASLARHYLPASSYMTAAELETELRQLCRTNGRRGKDSLQPGETLLIPGMNGPISEAPQPVAKDFEVRAIYLTGTMAASERGRELIRRWRALGGNAVVFDVKDSDGIVNIPFEHPLDPNPPHPAIRNLPKFTRFLHQLGMHGIARIAIFRDQRLVERHPELAVRSRRSGASWQENGKLVWTDPSRPEVQQYNIALARAAAQGGVDEVQFDYIRFPAEGDQRDAEFAFQTAHPRWKRTDVISDFLSQAYSALHPLKVLFSLDVFGVMAWQRPADLTHTGQDIVAMARLCEVLSPMIYPSHFFGMDGFALPGDAPEHFITESMDRFRQITAGSGVVLRPWLQAFGWRTPSYSPRYIETEVRLAREKGGIGFLFWNARNDYSKPFQAMPIMRADERYFRGDELPSETANVADTLSSPPPSPPEPGD